MARAEFGYGYKKLEASSAIQLTFKQSRVAVGLVFGLSIREIADHSNSSESTINKHIIALKKKFGVDSRQALMVTLLKDKKLCDQNLYYHFYPVAKKEIGNLWVKPISIVVETRN